MVVCAFALPLAAAAGRPPPSSISWADFRHGWAPCVPDERELCSTEDGGKTWRGIFWGGNYFFAYVRTSATSGIVQSGNTVASTYWTRTNGRRWYELPNVPKPDLARGDDRIGGFAGRGAALFWTGTGLNQITGWPARADPPCCTTSSTTISLRRTVSSAVVRWTSTSILLLRRRTST